MLFRIWVTMTESSSVHPIEILPIDCLPNFTFFFTYFRRKTWTAVSTANPFVNTDF